MTILKAEFRVPIFKERSRMPVGTPQLTESDEGLVEQKLEKLAEQILALRPEELETLELMLEPVLMEEILKRSEEARMQPENLLTFEEVFGGPIEDVQREIDESSETGHS